MVKLLANLIEPTLNLNENGKRIYSNRFADLTDFYLIILYLTIKLISNSNIILNYKYLIIKVSFRRGYQFRFFNYLFPNL